MIEKLLDEPHFKGLRELVEERHSLYPGFLHPETWPYYNKRELIISLITFPEIDNYPGSKYFASTPVMPEVIQYVEENLDLLKLTYLDLIMKKLLDAKDFKEMSGRFQEMKETNDVRRIHEYYMSLGEG